MGMIELKTMIKYHNNCYTDQVMYGRHNSNVYIIMMHYVHTGFIETVYSI